MNICETKTDKEEEILESMARIKILFCDFLSLNFEMKRGNILKNFIMFNFYYVQFGQLQN